MTVPTNRKIHAVKINLRGLTERGVIVWVNNTEKLCIRLMNGRRTWLTTQAGDSVLLRANRETVESVELY